MILINYHHGISLAILAGAWKCFLLSEEATYPVPESSESEPKLWPGLERHMSWKKARLADRRYKYSADLPPWPVWLALGGSQPLLTQARRGS